MEIIVQIDANRLIRWAWGAIGAVSGIIISAKTVFYDGEKFGDRLLLLHLRKRPLIRISKSFHAQEFQQDFKWYQQSRCQKATRIVRRFPEIYADPEKITTGYRARPFRRRRILSELRHQSKNYVNKQKNTNNKDTYGNPCDKWATIAPMNSV